MKQPHTTKGRDETKYKVGDTVCMQQCWEDESGAYHDEFAEILHIYKNGKIKLSWLNVSDEVLKFLKSFTYTLEDIAYLS